MKNSIRPLDLLFQQVRELYSVEVQLRRALPKLASRASHPSLRAHLLHHGAETDRQLGRLAGLLSSHGLAPEGETCRTIAGLIEGMEDCLSKVEDVRTRDLMMLSYCLRIENHEISVYGIASRLAARLGLTREAGILSSILSEEDFAMKALRALEGEIFETAGGNAPKKTVRQPAFA